MRKTATRNALVEKILNAEYGDENLDAKLEHFAALRQDPDQSRELDRSFLERMSEGRKGLLAAKKNQQKLKEMLDELTATPWYPGTLIQLCNTAAGPRALVQLGNTQRLVGFVPEMDTTTVGVGSEVFLNNELNLIMESSPNTTARGGETATFERKTEDGRLVLRARDEEIVMDPAMALVEEELNAGDILRCDRSVWIAFEKLARQNGNHLFLEETPTTTFDEIGGLGKQINRVKHALNLHVFHGEIARRYGLRRKGSILLAGPSGTGKTMIAQAVANWLATTSPSGHSRFMNIKPSQLHSMWYSQSEANYREAFRLARAEGAANPDVPIVMFFDEVDSLGMARGQANAHVDDRVLTAFMTELDGLADRGQNIVVIGATNRRASLDPALLRPGRMGDLVLDISRPKRKAARDILDKHLPLNIPYARNGHGDDFAATRQEILDTVISRIYAPNADNELATLQFRDGKRRSVHAADLVSGALIENIVSSAIEKACVRDVETGETGLRLEDLETSMVEEFNVQVTSLSPANCRQHLTDLPQDMDVVSLQPIQRGGSGHNVRTSNNQ